VWGRLLLVVLVAVVVASSAAARPGDGNGSAGVFVAPNGSDGGACTQAAPCASLDRAYHVAAPGQTVSIAAGTYPSEVVTIDPTKLNASADVVFQPAPGATVQLGNLDVYGSHAVFRGFQLEKLIVDGTAGESQTAHNLTFDNLHAETFNVGPTHDITIENSDFGPSVFCYARGSATDPSTWCPAGSPYAQTGNTDPDAENHIGPDGTIMNQWPHDIVVSGVRIHDQNSLDLDTMHTGGLFLISGYDITIRNSIFQQDAVYDVQVQDFSNPDCCGMTFGPVHDVVLQGNWFGAPVRGLNDPGGATTNDDQPEVQLDPRNGACWKNWSIRLNAFYNGLALGFDAQPCFSNVTVAANIGESPGPVQCWPGAPGLTWLLNLWVGGSCGRTDIAIPRLPYANTTIGHENFNH
jgi:hypothetical protein